MKLSNKILIGFFGFIFLYLTAAFAELRLNGTPNAIDDNSGIVETADVSAIGYLIVDGLEHDVKVIGSDRSQIQVRSFSGDVLKKLKYNVSGDTLTLSDFDSNGNKPVTITVFVPNSTLKGLIVNSSVVNVKSVRQELLHIAQNHGNIWMADNRIGKIELRLSNQSYINISSTTLDTLSTEIEGSEAMISSPVGVLQGSMNDKSFMQVNDIEEIQLKKDRTSKLNIY